MEELGVPLGLHLDEVLSLPLGDLDLRLRRFREEDERRWEGRAWMVRHLLGAWVKNPPTIEQLLGRRQSAEEFDTFLDDLAVAGELD